MTKKPKPFCPFFLIGFPAPEKDEQDIRRCSSACALYSEDGDCCSIKRTADMLEEYIVIMTDGYFPTPYEEEESYEFDPNTKTN